MLLSDRKTGLLIVALGALCGLAGSRLPPVPGQQVGPNVFPMVIGAGLVVCGLLIALGVGRRFEVEAEADVAEHGEAPAEPPVGSGLKVMLPPALLIFYVLAVDRLGFVPTAGLMALVAAFALGATWRLALALALLGPVGVHLVFAKLLRVPLPPGLLPMPW
jgi:putative tricarboxylic transport membrane protein